MSIGSKEQLRAQSLWQLWVLHGAVGRLRVERQSKLKSAVLTAMVPACVKEVMADPTASAELKVKRASDYDDVVRDHLKRVDDKANRGYQFNRDCGRAIEALMAKTATKS